MLQMPDFYNTVFKDQSSFHKLIRSPESLLSNLFEGLENHTNRNQQFTHILASPGDVKSQNSIILS